MTAPLEETAGETTARGLDPDQVRADLPTLLWLKLVERRGERLTATDRGAAVHYRSLYEASEERLSEIARFAQAQGTVAPDFARAVRLLAQKPLSSTEA
ncbi:hypothetical protein OG357_37240 [Streptomyces sp. NBC_01255]|uniref:hypothetical protein n=1 Tax=Streptomyces sp. NBC_01255 TaxID=2903798 RepID=UPI002E2F2B4F|nr:hypothetical protein [Streptomyces sp. NBC_01255]